MKSTLKIRDYGINVGEAVRIGLTVDVGDGIGEMLGVGDEDSLGVGVTTTFFGVGEGDDWVVADSV